MKKFPKAEGEPMQSTILTLSEVCSYLQVSQVTVYRLLRRRNIPAFRIGKKWRFKLEDLERWIEQGSVPGAESSTRQLKS